MGLYYEIGPFVEIGLFVGIGQFGGTGPVVSLTYRFYKMAGLVYTGLSEHLLMFC